MSDRPNPQCLRGSFQQPRCAANRLQAEIDSLRAELATANERLSILQKESSRIDVLERLGPIDNIPYYHGGEWHIWLGHPEEEANFPNIRAAIDAAKAREG